MSKKIHIAFLIDKYGGKSIGGGEVHLKNLSSYLEKNHNCTYKIYSQENDSIIARLLWDFWIIPIVVFNHLKKKNDILHSHGFSSGPVAWILGKILNIPIIHTVHGSHLMDLKDKTLKGKLENFFLTQIPYDVEISVSQSFLDYKSKAKKIEVITNGVEITDSVILNPTRQQLSVSGFKHRPINLLTVSRLENQKGIDILIKAVANIKQSLPTFHLKIVGSGSLLHELKKLTKQLNLEKNVTFAGKKTGRVLEQEYQKADLFILPSLAEGQPIAILEAWSHKLPVIATRVGHNPFMIKEGETGWLCKSRDITALETTIKKAFSQIEKWAEIGENGYHQVEKHYTWNKITEKIYYVYNEVKQK